MAANNKDYLNQQPLLKDPLKERIDVPWPPAESTPTKWSPVDDFAAFKESWREATLRCVGAQGSVYCVLQDAHAVTQL